MDVEQSGGAGYRKVEEKSEPRPPPRNRKCRNICLGITGVVLAIVVLLLILGFTVFKPKHPVTTLGSVGIDRMSASVDVARMKAFLNVTLDVNLSLKNPNRVGFKYSPASAIVNYRGEMVGEAPLPAGKISSRQTVPIDLKVTLMADRLISNSQLLSDVMADSLPVNVFVKISGKVNVLGIKIKVKSSTTCDFTITISNQTVSHLDCKYSTKL